MEKEEENGYYNHEGDYIESPKKHFFRIRFPFVLRFAIIWTLFFSIVGIGIELISNQNLPFSDIFKNFFTSNFIAWIKSFGNFTDTTSYPDAMSFIQALLNKWYYFFYTGGLLALIWGILSWIIHGEIVIKSPNKYPRIQETKSVQEIKPLEEIKIDEKPKIYQQTPESNQFVQNKIQEWLEAGLLLLSEGNILEAELIYEQISKEYNSLEDIDHKTYKRILDFYYEINEKRREKR
jgi:hypothetical protein